MKPFTRLTRFSIIHRRALATICVMMAVLSIGMGLPQGHDDTTTVYAAKERIAAGTVLDASLIETIAIPIGLAPSSAVIDADAALGKMTSAAIAAGSILTSESFVAQSEIPAGNVITPLDVDPDVLALLAPGSLVTVMYTDPESGTATSRRDLRVVTVPATVSGGLLESSGPSRVLLQVPEDLAVALSAAADLGSITVAAQ
ncbi:MAG: SAF domain-containing protein [Propionibacteriaceae bacterium]|jgi:Flp pilus assembly protein CpaB|nr:SAF domain-containing protein [Propionibacteriaceae bacterium]